MTKSLLYEVTQDAQSKLLLFHSISFQIQENLIITGLL